MRRTKLLLTVALVLAAAGSVRAQGELGPRVVRQPPLAKPLPTAVPRAAALPQATSLAASALLRFADGAGDANDVDRSVARALSRVPDARAIAQRIAARIRGLPAPDQQAAFGDRQRHLARAVTAADYVPLANPSIPSVGRASVSPASSPAPAAKPAASRLSLHLTAVACRKAADADGVDEPVALAAAVVPSASGFASVLGFRRLPPSGSGKLAAGQSLAANVPVYAGSSGFVLVSALLEDDDGDSGPRAADVHLLTELGVGLAAATGGADPLAALQARIEDALALLRVHEPARWGEKAARARVVRASEWSTAPTKRVSGTPSRTFETVHDTDGGDYALRFHVNVASP